MRKITAIWDKKSLFALPIVALLMLFACESDDLSDHSITTEELALTVTNTDMVLDPNMYLNNYTFRWTTGNSMGTSASISYKLEIDRAENNFSNPIEYDFGKNKFSFDLNVSSLNQMLLTTFGATAGTPVALQARIIATFGNESVAPQISVVNMNFTPYVPLTTSLYIVGDATPNGWDIGNASEMTQSASNPMEFVYSGELNSGNFKFAVNRESCWCQNFYTKDSADANKMVFNEGGSGEDIQWTVETAGMYKVTVNVLTLSIKIETADVPRFTQLWIVGDATPSGWNIDTPQPFTVTENPFVFTYEAVLTPGNFKILAGATGDWCGEWYRPLVDNQVLTETTVAQNSGCDNDKRWLVTAETAGRYKITLNTSTNVINITPVEVYLIGSATPNGWSMGSLTPMTKNGSVYTWTGELTAGEMKFVKFNTSWCGGTEIVATMPNQSITNTSFGFNENCNGNDYKWLVSAAQAGTHSITLNLETNTLIIN